MSDPRCKCSMAISVTGDGCRYCQPQEYIDRLGEVLADETDERAALARAAAEFEEWFTAVALDHIPNGVYHQRGGFALVQKLRDLLEEEGERDPS